MNKEDIHTEMSINVQNAITSNTVNTTAVQPRQKRKYTKRKAKTDEEEKDEGKGEGGDSKKRKTRTSTKPRPPRVPTVRADGSCQVCCEAFNVTSNSLIVCPMCPYKACKSCHQRYLLSSISTPHCMNCRNRWTYKNLLTLFKQSFVTKTFRKQRGQYLLDRAKSHLPLAMPYASVENDIKALDQEIRPLSKEFQVLRRDVRYSNAMTNLTPKEREKRYLRYNEVANLLYTKTQERRVLWNKSYKARNRRQVETYTSFEEPCPVDDCRGFIEKCGQRCGICKTFVCRKCTKVLGKIKEETKVAKPITSTDAVNDEELDNVIEQIQAMEKREQIEKDLNDFDEKNENDFEGMEEYGNEEKEEALFTEQKEEDEKKTDQPTASTDQPEDDEKLLSSSNLSDEEKKELRKLKKAHKCKQEDVDSVKEIRQHSRACPSCKARIFRISGCDTMWCTRCNTGFNWRTGMVIKDARDLHNPHYIDFVRHNPGFQYSQQRGQSANGADEKNAVIDNPCDRLTIETIQLPDAYSVLRRISIDTSIRAIISAFQQQMLHVRDYARRKFMAGNQYDETEYALRYVTKRWDEKRWRIMVEHHDRFRQTNQEYVDVIMTWLVVMNDLFATHLMSVHSITADGAKRFIEQMRHISEYTNTTLKEMNTMYKRKTLLIEIPADVRNDTFMTELWNRLKGLFMT